MIRDTLNVFGVRMDQQQFWSLVAEEIIILFICVLVRIVAHENGSRG